MSDTNNGKSSGLSFQQPSEVDLEKRKFLINATAATGAVGVAAVAVPFVGSMLPSERAKAAGAPVEVDVSKLEPGKGRAIKEKYAVMLGTCTHLGCSPNPSFAVTPDWDGGFVCPCHGSKFDLAGRVFKGSPAPTNLVVPAYQYLTETTILIGEDKKAEA